MAHKQNRLSQEVINHHFISVARGHRPQKRGKLTIISSQVGSGKETQPRLVVVSPTAQAVEQEKSDLKRGVNQTGVLEHALQQDATRKKKWEARKRRRKAQEGMGKKRSNRKIEEKRKKPRKSRYLSSPKTLPF